MAVVAGVLGTVGVGLFLWVIVGDLLVAEALTVGLDDRPEGLLRPGPASGLTLRESEITALVARGLTNRQIAGQLYISVRTVEAHVDHILTNLGLRTRTQLASWAHEEGLSSRNT